MFTALRHSKLHVLIILCLVVIINSSSYQVIKEASGSVKAGEYNLYKVQRTSTLALALISDRGDVDLYVSLSEEPPTFELYDYASQTCGAEVVIIPEVNKAEASQHFAIVGVYGHIRYNTSQFRLYVIKCEVDLEFLDTLKVANDPMLVDIVRRMQPSQNSNESPHHFWSSLGEWVVWILINGLEFGVEVFL